MKHFFKPLLFLTLVTMILSGSTWAQSAMGTSPFLPGDAVEISVFPDTTSFINGVYPIDGTGSIYLPLSGKMMVNAMSDEAFLEFIKRTYKQYLRSPNIQIRHLIRICMIGGFNKSGFYYVDPDETLWHVLYRAGGLVKEEAVYELTWHRGTKILSENMATMLESGQSLQQLGFKSGDQLNVPLPDTPTFWEDAGRFSPILTVLLTLFIAINQ